MHTFTFHFDNLFAGLLAGLICALGGAVKDAPYEGFRTLTFIRSIWVGTLGGLLSCFVTDNFYLAFAVAGYSERVACEGWKILRVCKPGKFDVGEWGIPKAVSGLKRSN